jgi:thiol-disulfide isomerase/thioredoxin
MDLRPVVSAALLALFAAACQPAEKPAEPGPETVTAPEATPAPAGSSQLASFKTGKFDRLDFDVDLAAPTSSFVDETGKAHSFAEYKGKVLVYNIWAEWCGPCVEEMPSLARLQKAFEGKDVAVVPVAYGFGQGVTRESTLAKFRSLVGTDLPFYYDGEQVLQSEAQTGALPATLIYDKTGKEVGRVEGEVMWTSAEVVDKLKALAAAP